MKTEKKVKNGSLRQKMLVFSLILFMVIVAGGSTVFIFSIRNIVEGSKFSELTNIIKLEGTNLQISVNGEIAIALKMADSPLIKKYFANPYDPELEKIAFEEIAGYRWAFAASSVFWVNDKDHLFYSDDNPPFKIDVNDPANYWYQMTMYQTEKYNFNINYNPDLKVTNLWINAPVFDNNRKPIGILGTGIDLSAFVDSIYSNFTGDASLYFFNENGEITGADDPKLVANKVALEKQLPGSGTKILNLLKKSGPEDILAFIGPEGEIAAGRIPAIGWYVLAVHPITLVDYINNSMTILFIVIIFVILAIFVVFNVMIAAFLRPLNEMVTILDRISTDQDLTRRLEIHQKDEIGTAGKFFNQTFSKICELLLGIKGKASLLSETGNELSGKMDGTINAIDKINSVIGKMKNHIMSQNDEVNRTTRTVEKIISSGDSLNNQITVQAESVAHSSSAIEQMLANVQSVTDTLVKNQVNITSLGESSEAGRTDLQKVSTDIQEIAKESEGLLEINSVMQNIASQTNLLSMNAAIEAAHAGDAGRGFAVVADEIRKLAEDSGKQSKTISLVLQKIKASIDGIQKSTGIMLERFNKIEDGVETVSSQENHIRSAMEEQGIGSRLILEAITQLNSVTDQVKRASVDLTAESKDARKQNAALLLLTTEVSGSMDEITDSADQITLAAARVKEISGENSNDIGVLNTEIAKFKVN